MELKERSYELKKLLAEEQLDPKQESFSELDEELARLRMQKEDYSR